MTKRLRSVGSATGLLLVALVGGCFLFPNQVPEASFAVVYDVSEDSLVVDLDASSSIDPDGAIVAYQWAFSDDLDIVEPLAYSTVVTAEVLRVRCPVQGEYNVILVVRDDEGANSTPVSGTIVVPSVPVEPMP